MKVRIYYHKAGCIEIETESVEDAIATFEDSETSELDRNCFDGSGYSMDDWEVVKE